MQLSWKATKVSGQSTRLVIIGGVVFEKKLLLGSFIKKAAQEVFTLLYTCFTLP